MPKDLDNWERIAATFDRAIHAAANAAAAAFRAEIQRPATADRRRASDRFKPDSWKYTVMHAAERLVANRSEPEFRYRELAKFEEEFKQRHPGQASPMNGAAVVLRQLVDEGVLRQVARGIYRVV